MKRTLLLSGAAVALTLGLTPALAQDHADSTMKRDQRAIEQPGRNPAQHAKTPDRHSARSTADKDRTGRGTTGQSTNETAEKPKAAETNATKSGSTDTTKSGAETPKSADTGKTSSQPKHAEEQNRKPSTNAANDKAGRSEPAKNAERNTTRSPTAQKSTETTAPNKNAQSNEPNRNSERTANDNARSKTQVSASLDPKKKTELHAAFAKIDAKPVTHVNFSVSVGTVVPRTLELRPVPTRIVEIVPQYRGYDFVLVRDEVVIVEPRTHKIVDVIERSGPSRARAETTTVHRPHFSARQREIIRRHATSRRTVTTGGAPRTTTEVTVGETVPDSVTIESFPEEVYREVPDVRSYRYIERGGDVYLVDPSDRRVIEEVR